MDIPLISQVRMRLRPGREICQRQGRSVRQYDGHDAHAWNDPVKGGELAKSQIDRGADVVYAAAGATGQGVLKAAADAGKLGIGVDSDQNGLFPGKVLTSMLKHVDVATYKSFKTAKDGAWKPGINVFGLKEGGVGYAVDDINKALITAGSQKAASTRRRPTSSPARSRSTITWPTTSARSEPRRLSERTPRRPGRIVAAAGGAASMRGRERQIPAHGDRKRIAIQLEPWGACVTDEARDQRARHRTHRHRQEIRPGSRQQQRQSARRARHHPRHRRRERRRQVDA